MKSILTICLLLPLCLFGQNQTITGVWELTASSWTSDTKEYADCRIIKFITPSRWASLFYRPENGSVAGVAGGTYTYDGVNYVEHLEIFTFDSMAVGSHQFFKQTVLGDGTMKQEGKIHTEKFDMPYAAYYRKIDALHDHREHIDFVTGTWALQQATWGDAHRDGAFIEEKYGRIIKIITPKYYLCTYFDSDHRKVGGVVFGRVNIQNDKFQEELVSWSWDPSAIGTQPVFNWTIEQDQLRQFGKLEESDEYKNYTIDEYYERIEPVWVISDH